MTDFSDPQTANLRLANAERDEAVAQLNANLREGRIDEQEFVKRCAVVRSAVTRGDLAPVFGDLPAAPPAPPGPLAAGAPGPGPGIAGFGSHPGGGPGSHTPPPPASVGPPPPSPPLPDSGRRGPLGGTAGTVAVSLAPLVALILFFLTGAFLSWNFSWLWFILVPVVYIIVYGAGTRDRPGRDR
ncbi:DUF1707 SHOCT-like domain-containing protein [Subtercola sp. YIM 133946]|uniref:DUF1707 SHOCT-like domain-containing protein n=1 Tax=Subtercola sp. YIM 133946 TaxID=3118909 RepID=UPI002F946291